MPRRSRRSWVAKELKKVRNAKPLWTKFGTVHGHSADGLDLWVEHAAGAVLVFRHDEAFEDGCEVAGAGS